MKSKPQYYHRLRIYMICICLMIFASFQLCKGSSKEEGNERTLSRRRRHLIFPEGSSFQVGFGIFIFKFGIRLMINLVWLCKCTG